MFDGSLSTDNVGVVNWTWSLEYRGRSYRGYGVESSFKYGEPGFYSVTLIVADEAGLRDHTSFTVVVTEAEETEDRGSVGTALAVMTIVLGTFVVIIILGRRRKAEPSSAQPE